MNGLLIIWYDGLRTVGRLGDLSSSRESVILKLKTFLSKPGVFGLSDVNHCWTR